MSAKSAAMLGLDAVVWLVMCMKELDETQALENEIVGHALSEPRRKVFRCATERSM
jgi:hypothetical protein